MMLVSTVILILLHQVSPHDFLYSEIEQLGASCYPWDSCKPSRNESDDHLWGNYSCECEEHCIRYSTCCPDSSHFGKILYVHYRGETCKKLPFVSDAIVMVSHCSDRWRNGFEVLQKCETSTDDLEDPFSMTPVTSLETNITYKNFFCAMCNYEYNHVYAWNISLSLMAKQTTHSLQNITNGYILENMIYSIEQKSWVLIIDDAYYKLNLRFQVTEFLRKLVKKCYRNVVTNCDPAHANSNELQYKCWAYYAPIQIKEEGKHIKKYRNIHCALCNNVNVTAIDMNVCKLDDHVRKRPKPAFSFALLLDINKSDGNFVGLKKICEEDQKWDPFFKKCRSLACAVPGYIIKNGNCVPGN